MDKCQHPGCTVKVFNRYGLCTEHRKIKCVVDGCETRVVYQRNVRFCKEHKNLRDYKAYRPKTD